MTPDQIVAFAEGLARISASGGGPKALCAHLASAAGGGVLLEDAQWHHLAAAGTNGLPPTARAVVEAGAPGRSVRVMAGGTHAGWLSVFRPPESDGDDDTEYLLRLTAAAVGTELARDAPAGRGKRQTFWERALTQTYHDANALRDDAAAHGVTLAPAYVAVALELEASGDAHVPPDTADLRALAGNAFRSNDGDVGLLERDAALYAFVPAAREIDASNARTAAKLLPKNAAKYKAGLRVCGGVGCVAALPALARTAQSARAALDIGRRVYGGGHVAVYEELGAYPLLYEGAGTQALCRFARDVLAPLRAYDEKHQTELRRTLALYFAVGENVKTAAAQLNVHRHTVFYRLRQIGEICGCSLENQHDQLTLRLAVAIDALHA